MRHICNDGCGLNINFHPYLQVTMSLGFYDVVHISAALKIEAPYGLNYPYATGKQCDDCENSGLNMNLDIILTLTVEFKVGIKGLIDWSPGSFTIDILPQSVKDALSVDTCYSDVYIPPLYYR